VVGRHAAIRREGISKVIAKQLSDLKWVKSLNEREIGSTRVYKSWNGGVGWEWVKVRFKECYLLIIGIEEIDLTNGRRH
jgi:thymidylate kinase